MADAPPKPTVAGVPPAAAAAVPDTAGQSPAEGVASWESAIADLSAPEPAPQPAAAPAAPAPAAAAKQGAAAPPPGTKADAPKEPPPPAKAGTPPPEAGRKSKLDPDQLLSFDGDGDVQLPKDVVETLQKLDARDLRLQSAKVAQALRATGKKVKALEAELSQARAPKEDTEKQTLTSQLTETKRRNEELERRLRQVAYTESPEYKEKYQAPFVEALEEAYSYVKEFRVSQEDGTDREASQADFDRLVSLPHGEAIKVARTMFGDAASEILARRTKLIELQRSARKAIDKYKAEGDEISKRQEVERTEQQAVRRKIWEEANTEIPKRWPKHFGEIPGDEEGNNALRQGYEIVDRVNDQSLPERDRLFIAAVVRHRAAAFGRAANVAARLAKENAELKQIIKDYEESAPVPKAKDGGAPPAADEDADWRKQIDDMGRPA